jgi:hypothetical protein
MQAGLDKTRGDQSTTIFASGLLCCRICFAGKETAIRTEMLDTLDEERIDCVS